MRIPLVTGGAGFIGSHLVKALVSRGERVRVFDNLVEGKLSNLESVFDRIEFVRGDLRSPHEVESAVRDVDVIFHQAALRSVPPSVKDPASYNEVNVTGMLRLLLAAREAGVRRIVYASSSSVYGGRGNGTQAESQAPMPLSPYAVTKLAGELYARVFTEIYGLETVGLRYFNVFGPGQDPASAYAAVIPKFILSALEGAPLEIHGDGLQSRDFTFIDNAVLFNLLAAEARNVAGEVFNVGCGGSITILEMKQALEKVLGTGVACYHTEPRPGDVRLSRADINKAREMLGYEPKVTFEEGLRRTVDFFSVQRPPRSTEGSG